MSTDVADFAEFIEASYGPQLSSGVSPEIGSISILRRGTDDFEVLDGKTSLKGSGEPKFWFPHLKREILEGFMRSRPQLLWFHAGAVEKEGRAALICGPSASGKSTITLGLCARGWRLLSDDVSPVRLDQNVVMPFFEGAMRRLDPGAFIDDPYGLGELERETVLVEIASLQREPTPFTKTFFPEFTGTVGARIDRMDPGQAVLALVRNITNFFDHRNTADRKSVV